MGDDGFQVAKQKTKAKPRAYIGNLRVSPDLSNKLFYLFQERGFRIDEKDISVQKQKSCFALVTCSNVDRLVSRLNGVEFDGRKLVVQREQKKGGNGKKPSFGGGWAAPTKPSRQAPPTSILKTASPAKDAPEQVDATDHQDAISINDFRSRCQKPLSELMGELGEQDLDFGKVVPNAPPEPSSTEQQNLETSYEDSNSRLSKLGKAPIHVEFRSYGYVYGAPSSKGWSHSHPLPPLDCCELPSVPPWMARQDGKSSAVKRILVTDELKSVSNSLADQAADALVEAITDGHGHAMPLRMTIHVGSENGRHRSVVLCEEAGKALRRRLRENAGNRLQEDVSVGTAHQDIDRKRDTREKYAWAKPGELADEW